MPTLLEKRVESNVTPRSGSECRLSFADKLVAASYIPEDVSIPFFFPPPPFLTALWLIILLDPFPFWKGLQLQGSDYNWPWLTLSLHHCVPAAIITYISLHSTIQNCIIYIYIHKKILKRWHQCIRDHLKLKKKRITQLFICQSIHITDHMANDLTVALFRDLMSLVAHHILSGNRCLTQMLHVSLWSTPLLCFFDCYQAFTIDSFNESFTQKDLVCPFSV